MTKVVPRRVTAQIEGDFVVLLVGMRINKPWKIHKWFPVFRAMRMMLRELEESPESGCLGQIKGFGVIVQYWRSFDHLEAYARNPARSHWPAWVDFNKRVGGSRGDVGVWHETYRVRAGEYESVYSGMPPMGLARASSTTDAVFESARGRMEGGRGTPSHSPPGGEEGEH